MQSLPELQKRHLSVQVVIVGGDEGATPMLPMMAAAGSRSCWKNWRSHRPKKTASVWPHPMISCGSFIGSTLHVLSKAFVLSWSLLEVMASGTPVLAEKNPMMED